MMYRIIILLCLHFYVLNAVLYMKPSSRCYYGDRGSLTATCENATSSYFRTTSYRFDNLDETVRCLNCNLENIQSNAFDISGNHILNLDLQDSNITGLSPSAFVGLVYMENLNLAHNSIKNIVPGTFRGIKKLLYLNIAYNNITVIVRDGFSELGNLTTLYLNDNLIKSLDSNAFDKLASLTELYLQNNQINKLESAFIGLSSIIRINLENNEIDVLRPFDVNLTTLLDLNLARNKLRSLEPAIHAPVLEKLNLSHNAIELIKPSSFIGCRRIEFLDLEDNKITDLIPEMFIRLHSVRIINLPYNKLNILKTSVFTPLPELRYLNVSHNQIKGFQRGGVMPLHNLHSLDISYNDVTYFDYKLLIKHAPRLVLINLEFNNLPCYLVHEMMEFFINDYIEFSVDDKYGQLNETCNSTISKKDEGEIISETAKYEAVTVESARSSPNLYVVYSLIFILIGLVVVLFFLQYKTYMFMKYGHQDVAEVGLMSSRGLENRDNEY